MHPAFKIYEDATPELIQFLEETVLGTNGARYQHLDTENRVKELENPLHLSLIRNEKILANITFCRRGKNWYIRYFAFDRILQSSGSKNRAKTNSTLKKELRQFFEDKIKSGEVDCFYAYIDPKNNRSSLFAEELGFTKNGSFNTQTFSRLKPKLKNQVILLNIEDLSFKEKLKTFEGETFYHRVNNSSAFYGLLDNSDSLLAFASAQQLNWQIHRLPGRFGKLLTTVIPFVPFLRKIIVPKHHQFIGLDHVFVEQDDPFILEQLFEGILAIERSTLAIWWIDSRLKTLDGFKWGPAHRFLQSNPVDLYVLKTASNTIQEPYFLISTDFS